MKIEINKSGELRKYYSITGNEELYSARELLRAVIAMIRAKFNITDYDLKEDTYY